MVLSSRFYSYLYTVHLHSRNVYDTLLIAIVNRSPLTPSHQEQQKEPQSEHGKTRTYTSRTTNHPVSPVSQFVPPHLDSQDVHHEIAQQDTVPTVATHFTSLTRLLARPTISLLCYYSMETKPLGCPSRPLYSGTRKLVLDQS